MPSPLAFWGGGCVASALYCVLAERRTRPWAKCDWNQWIVHNANLREWDGMPRPGNASIDSDVGGKKIPRGVKRNFISAAQKTSLRSLALFPAAAGLTRNGYANRKMRLCRHVGGERRRKGKKKKKIECTLLAAWTTQFGCFVRTLWGECNLHLPEPWQWQENYILQVLFFSPHFFLLC